MAKFCAVKAYYSKLIIVIIVALTVVRVFSNTFVALYSSSPSASVAAAGVSNTYLHSLSASFVRVEAPDSVKPGSKAQLVLSIESAELSDFIDAYKRGFTEVGHDNSVSAKDRQIIIPAVLLGFWIGLQLYM